MLHGPLIELLQGQPDACGRHGEVEGKIGVDPAPRDMGPIDGKAKCSPMTSGQMTFVRRSIPAMRELLPPPRARVATSGARRD